MKSFLKNIIEHLWLNDLRERLTINSLLLAKQQCERVKNIEMINSFEDVEFQVSSQWGEDGIIQYLINNVSIPNKVFVEFGVANYSEANTRFLLTNNNWRGLVIDGSQENISHIKKQSIYMKNDLTAIAQFITKENINQIISGAGIEGDIGILSVDIDGNDYWVWEAINVISPRIIICEYNSLFGSERGVTVPYKKDFQRQKEHYSNLYYGASLSALCYLAKLKGFAFVGSNTAGNNAFFVRKDVVGNLKELTAHEGYVESKFREARDKDGKLTFARGNDRIEIIADLEVYDVEYKKIIKIRECNKIEA